MNCKRILVSPNVLFPFPQRNLATEVHIQSINTTDSTILLIDKGDENTIVLQQYAYPITNASRAVTQGTPHPKLCIFGKKRRIQIQFI